MLLSPGSITPCCCHLAASHHVVPTELHAMQSPSLVAALWSVAASQLHIIWSPNRSDAAMSSFPPVALSAASQWSRGKPRAMRRSTLGSTGGAAGAGGAAGGCAAAAGAGPLPAAAAEAAGWLLVPALDMLASACSGLTSSMCSLKFWGIWCSGRNGSLALQPGNSRWLAARSMEHWWRFMLSRPKMNWGPCFCSRMVMEVVMKLPSTLTGACQILPMIFEDPTPTAVPCTLLSMRRVR
mmetsp:Transcript_25693/g.55969  ORF Transcript_25693/g.55969 Transcript_25693/m.55969 type:complete len:239 (+) Transcript_25693:369-1085(+)